MNIGLEALKGAKQPRKISIPTMIAFGTGEMAGSFKNMAWGVLLLFYYQQVVGVEAALVGLAIAMVYLTAYCALRWDAGIKMDERLVVSGAAGGVGLACVSIGAALGAEVTACASTPEKCSLALAHGATAQVCYGTTDLAASLKDIGGDEGFDVAADPVAGDVYAPLFRSLGWGGRYLSLGFAGGAIPQIPANLLLVKNRSAHGMVLLYYRRFRTDLLSRAAQELLDLVAKKLVRPNIDRVLPLARAPEGIQAIDSREVMGKIVLDIANV